MEKSNCNQLGDPTPLFPYCKIISCLKGYLVLREDHLKEIIMAYADRLPFPKDTPMAVLSIIGPRGSGKSLFTNLLIQYYKCCGDGGWLGQLAKDKGTQQQAKLTGFLWNSVDPSEGFFQPSAEDRADCGVYLWPQPFLIKVGGDKDLLVWILHLSRGDDEPGTCDFDVLPLERLLMLTSSRIGEIDDGSNNFKLLEHKKYLSEGHHSRSAPQQSEQICNSIVYILMSDKDSTNATTDDEAKKELQTMIRTSNKQALLDSSVLANFLYVNIVKMKKRNEPLHDKKGHLYLQATTKILKRIISTIVDDSEVLAKSTQNGEILTLDKFFQFMKSSVDTINKLSGQQALKTEVMANLPIAESVEVTTESKLKFVTGGDEKHLQKPRNMNATLLETNLDEICSGEMEYSKVPSSPNKESTTKISPNEENNFGFEVVEKEDCEEEEDSHQCQALSRSIITEEECNMLQGENPNEVKFKFSPSKSLKRIDDPKFTISGCSVVSMCKTTLNIKIYSNEKHELQIRDKLHSQNLSSVSKRKSAPDFSQNVVQQETPESTSNQPLNTTSVNVVNEKPVHSLAKAEFLGIKNNSPMYQTREPPLKLTINAQQQPHSSSLSSEKYTATNDNGRSLPSIVAATSSRPGEMEMEVDNPNCSLHETPERDNSMEVDENEMDHAAEAMKQGDTQPKSSDTMEALTEQMHRQNKIDKGEEINQEILEQRKRMVQEEPERKRLEQELVWQRQEREENLAAAAYYVREKLDKLKTMVYPTTEKWLNENLTLKNLAEIKNIFNPHIYNTQIEIHAEIDITMQNEMDQIIQQECIDNCNSYLSILQDKLEAFKNSMRRQFELHKFFTCLELNEIGRVEFEKTLRKLSPHYEIAKLVEVGCKKLMTYFSCHNQAIHKTEANVAKNLIPKVIDFYKKEMARYLKEEVYFSPNKLKNIHSSLIEKLMEVFRKSLALTHREGKFYQNVEVELEELRTSLVQQFPNYLQENNNKLKKLQEAISKIIQSSKTSYAEKIEAVLTQYPGGLEVKELTRRHVDIVTDSKKLLELEIRRKIRQNEHLEPHLKSLQGYIDEYWKTVLNVNSRNNKQREKEEAEEKVKLESERKLQRDKQIEERKAALATVKSKEHSKAAIPLQSSRGAGPKLPPLVFHICSRGIVMGMYIEGKPTIMKNSSGEEATPMTVGLGVDGTLVFGTEVIAALESAKDSNESLLREHWNVSSCFITNGNTAWSTTIQLSQGDLYRITVEFLLGFIMRRLKEHVESELGGGECKETIVAVPLWFGSTQRLQVKDAAKVAGFTDVYLVSETAAAAFACTSSENRKESANKIVILSENFGVFDAAVYLYAFGGNIKMIGHSGNYCTAEKKKGIVDSVCGFGKKFVSGAINFMIGHPSSTNGERSDEDKKLQMVRKVCNAAIQESQKSNTSTMQYASAPTEVLLMWQLENSKYILEKVGREVARLVGDVSDKTAVVFGAALLSQNPEDIREKLKDNLVFEVFRACGAQQITTMARKSYPLPVNKTGVKKLDNTLPQHATEGVFYQEGLSENSLIEIGQVTLSRTFKQVDANFSLNNEGIISLQDIKVTNSGRRGVDTKSDSEYLTMDDYTWTTPNLWSEELARLQSILDSLDVKQNHHNHELLSAKRELLKLCNEMKTQLNSLVKADIVKDMLIKKIAEAVEFAEHPHCTMEQIEKKITSMVQLKSTLMK